MAMRSPEIIIGHIHIKLFELNHPNYLNFEAYFSIP